MCFHSSAITPQLDVVLVVSSFISFRVGEEAARNMLLAGGRYDVTEMQRAAVERARLDEVRRLDKVLVTSCRKTICRHPNFLQVSRA